MNNTQILNLIDSVLPDIKTSGSPEQVLLKYARANNMPPAQLARVGQAYNTMMALTTQKMASNRGDSFDLLDVPGMMSDYVSYQPPAESVSKAASAAGMEKAASDEIKPGGYLPKINDRYWREKWASELENPTVEVEEVTPMREREIVSTTLGAFSKLKFSSELAASAAQELQMEMYDQVRNSCQQILYKVAAFGGLSECWPELRAEIMAGVADGESVVSNIKAYCKEAGAIIPDDGDHKVGNLLQDRFDCIKLAQDISDCEFQSSITDELLKTAFVKQPDFVREVATAAFRQGSGREQEPTPAPTSEPDSELTDAEIHENADRWEERERERERERKEVPSPEPSPEPTPEPTPAPEDTPEEKPETETEPSGDGDPPPPGKDGLGPDSSGMLPIGKSWEDRDKPGPSRISAELQGLLDGIGNPLFRSPVSVGSPLALLQKALDPVKGRAAAQQRAFDEGMSRTRAEAALQTAIMSTPILAKADPDEVNKAYQAIYKLAPHYAEDPTLLAPVLQETIQYGAVPMHIAGELGSQNKTRLDAEKSQAQLDAMKYSS